MSTPEFRTVNGHAVLQRAVEVGASVDAEARTIEFALSSEAPYERWWGIEILDHSPESIRLDRLAGGKHPLLVGHDHEKQVGVIESATVDADRKIRAKARFGRSAYATEILNDVADGIRSLVSVGYIIHKAKLVETGGGAGEREIDGIEFARMVAAGNRAGDGELDTYRITDWEPYEGSIVSIPADPTVGVGRELKPAPAEQPAQAETSERIIMTEAAIPAVDPQVAERARVAEIIKAGDTFAKYVKPAEVQAAVRDGQPAEAFKDMLMERIAARHTDTSDAHIGMTDKEVKRYSFGRALVAQMTGDWSKAGFEREASVAMARIMGQTPEGFYVPLDYLAKRDFNVGTSTEAGNLVPTDLRTDMYVDVLRNNLVVAQLGITVLPGLTSNVDLPRKSVAGTLGMLTEIGSASETNPNIQKATLAPHRAGAYVEVSKQALIQSAIALEGLIRDDLVTGAAVLIESQLLNGTGTAASDAQMKGLRNVTGIGTYAYGTNGGALDWTGLVSLESACADVNAEPDARSGYLFNTKIRGKAKRTTKSTYLSWLWDGGDQPVNGYRAAITNNLPSNLTKGTSTTICSAALFASDWSMGVLGLFGAPDVTVDPYTLAASGQVRITLSQFADFQVRQPACFSKCEDILTT